MALGHAHVVLQIQCYFHIKLPSLQVMKNEAIKYKLKQTKLAETIF
jgi:hypothetical protein